MPLFVGWIENIGPVEKRTAIALGNVSTYDYSLAQARPTADYVVSVMPSWATNVKITLKTVNGFTLTFGTATGDTDQTIDVLVI